MDTKGGLHGVHELHELLRSPQLTLHPKLPRLLPLPFRRGEGWGEGLLRVVYPTVLAVHGLPPPLRPRPFPYMGYIGGNEGLSLPTTED